MVQKKLIVITVIALLAIQISSVASVWKDVEERRPDFADLYGAARLIRSGQGLSYTSNTSVSGTLTRNKQSEVSLNGRVDQLHPPFEMVLFLPLAGLSYQDAYRIWLGLNLVFLWSVPFFLWSELPHLHQEFHFITILFGSFAPVTVCLIQGQDSILLLFLLTLSFLSMKTGKDFQSGILLGLGMFKFIIVIPILIGLLFRRRNWSLPLGFFCACVVLLVVSVALVGNNETAKYILNLLHYGSNTSVSVSEKTRLMPNFRGLLFSLLPRSYLGLQLTLLVSVLSFGTYLATILFLRRPRVNAATEMSMLLTVAGLISFHFYFHNAVILLLPLLLLANEMAVKSAGVLSQVCYAIAACSLYVVPLLTPLEVGASVIALGSAVLILSLVLCKRVVIDSETKLIW